MSGTTTYDELSNGMSVINAPIANNQNVSVSLVIRHGSCDETPRQSGYAKLISELFFTGTDDGTTTSELMTKLESMGAVIDVSAEPTFTVFQIGGRRPADLPVLLDVLAKLSLQAGLQAEDLEAARQSLLKKLDNSERKQELWVRTHDVTTAFSASSSLSRARAPLRASVQQMTRSDLLSYRKRFFDPASMAVVVTGGGRLTPKQVDDAFSGIASPTRPLVRARAVWQSQKLRTLYRKFPTAAHARATDDISVVMPGFSSSDPDRPAIRVLHSILSAGLSGRLFENVRERRGLAYYARSQPESFGDVGIFAIITATLPSKSVEAVRVAFDQIRDVAGVGKGPAITDDELARAKNAILLTLATAPETDSTLNTFYAWQWGVQRPFRSPKEELDAVEAVTIADVQRVARRLLAQVGKSRIVTAGPADQSLALLDAAIGTHAIGRGGVA